MPLQLLFPSFQTTPLQLLLFHRIMIVPLQLLVFQSLQIVPRQLLLICRLQTVPLQLLVFRNPQIVPLQLLVFPRLQTVPLQLLKYCEVVQDMALKPGDWLWYDEQFWFIKQSDPQQFPWDQIHWELWLRVSATFRRQQPFTNQPHTQPCQRFRSFFPKGTCWAFQAGKYCSGCQFEHVCYKCGAKHAGNQCSIQTRFGGIASKGKGSTTQVAGTSQPTSNPGKGRLA